MTLLDVNNLSCEFDTDEGRVRALDQVSFSVSAGETLGIVGESGCGKSVTALSIMRLLPQPMGQIVDGAVTLNGQDLTSADLQTMEKIRGNQIGMVFQEPMTALNPVQTIGKQLMEGILLHETKDIHTATTMTMEILEKVGIPSPDIRMGEFPHQLSGGMRQRVVIAIALACKPALLIADEPTTALDVTVQAQILALISELQNDLGMAVILITHDLGVIAETCDSVVVMYAGRVTETGSVFDIFDRPKHPYSKGLLASIPRLDTVPKTELPVIPGIVPGLQDLPRGCRFSDRCTHAQPTCSTQTPPLTAVPNESSTAQTHAVACLRWQEL